MRYHVQLKITIIEKYKYGDKTIFQLTFQVIQ